MKSNLFFHTKHSISMTRTLWTGLGVLLLTLSLWISPGTIAAQEQPDGIQVLSNSPNLADQFVAIDGDLIVWTVKYSEIHLYDLALQKEVTLVNNEYANNQPSISGNLIVYSSRRNDTYGIYICEYDQATGSCPEIPISTGMATASKPFIKDRHIVWNERILPGRAYRLDMRYCEYNALTQSCENYKTLVKGLSGGTSPVILDDLDTVVWSEEYANFIFNIYGVRISQPDVVYPVAGHETRSYVHVRASGNQLVFQSQTPGFSEPALETCELDTLNMVCLNQRTVFTYEWPGGMALEPDISGNTIVFRSQVLYDLFPQTVFTFDLYIYDLETDTLTQLTTLDFTSQSTPRISGHRIAFENTEVSVEQQDIEINGVIYHDVWVPVGQSFPEAALIDLGGEEDPDDEEEPGEEDPDNEAPVLEPVGPQSVAEGSILSFAVNASDPNGDPLSYSATPLPNGASFNPATQQFSWLPSAGQAGSYNIVFSVTDGTLSDEETVTITVSSPAVNMLANGSFEEGKTPWSGWATNKQLSTNAAYDGAYSAEFTLGGTEKKLNQLDKDVSEGMTYQISAAIKADNVTGGAAYIRVEWRKPGGALLRTDEFGQTSGTHNWAVHSQTLTAPAMTGKVKVFLVGDKQTTGTAYFDAVSMYEQ